MALMYFNNKNGQQDLFQDVFGNRMTESINIILMLHWSISCQLTTTSKVNLENFISKINLFLFIK